MSSPTYDKRTARIRCFGRFYTAVCFAVAATFAGLFGTGISDDYGGQREPSYDEAARLAGFFDSNGVYQGGLPKWRDWSEDAYVCHQASPNEKYCQAWSTERYYSDPEQEFLKGNCTCIRPLDGSVESTFDAWYNLYEDSQTTSSSEAAIQDADFCSAWNCREIRYTQQCSCSAYESQSSCSRRQLRRKSGGSNSGSSSCSTVQVCVAYTCVYLESNFYTACDCDSNGQRRAEWGPDWWREYTHCEDFTCLYGHNVVAMNESFSLSASATESASLPVENASLVPVDSTVVTGELEGIWKMEFTCTQTRRAQGNGSVWCDEWSGMTPYNNENVVEQLCGCTSQDVENSSTGEFCEIWTCTTYYMDACQVCWLEGVGIVLAGVISIFLVPLCSRMDGGFTAEPIIATLFGISAAGLVALYFGGWLNVWAGVPPLFFVSILLGRCFRLCRPTRVDPQPAPQEVKPLEDPKDAPTPCQTPMPVTGLAPVSPQTYQPPGVSNGITSGAYSYTPPGGQQQPMQQYSPPMSPGGFDPVVSYGGGDNQGARGEGVGAGGYQSPPEFKTGVAGAPGVYYNYK